MHDCSEDSNRPRKCAAEARYFAHCGERPKGVALWTPTTFVPKGMQAKKVDKTFRFENYFYKDFFDKLASFFQKRRGNLHFIV